MTCRPHRWNYEAWLPVMKSAKPDEHDGLTCLNCGRVLAVIDTSPNMRRNIARAIAEGVFDGDEYEEIFRSVIDFFTDTLNRVSPRLNQATHLGIGPVIDRWPRR